MGLLHKYLNCEFVKLLTSLLLWDHRKYIPKLIFDHQVSPFVMSQLILMMGGIRGRVLWKMTVSDFEKADETQGHKVIIIYDHMTGIPLGGDDAHC